MQPPCLRHNSSIKGRIALENRWDLMIASWPGLIDWMISSLSRQAPLPAAQPASHSSSSPLPVTLTLPPIFSPTPRPFNSVTLYPPILLSTPFSILYFPSLWELLCVVMCLEQWLPPNLQDSHFHKRSWCHNHCKEHHQDRFCLSGFKVFSHIWNFSL